MLEKSILTEENLKKEIKSRYNFQQIQKISKIPKGSANIFKIQCEKGSFILKEYQSSYQIKDLQEEERLLLLLIKKGIPCVKLITGVNKDIFWEKHHHVFVLQEFVDGKTKSSNTGSPREILESAKYLSKIHQALKGAKLKKQETIKKWLSKESLNLALQTYDKILFECEKKKTSSKIQKIKQDILFKRNLLKKVISDKKLINSLKKVTNLNSHGDYSVLQFVYDKNNKIKVILDFSAAAKLPAVWEIIRSYSYIDPYCKKGQISVNNLKKYVEEYLKETPLSKTDLEMMPYVYLIQLLKSPFGYYQYILENTKNKEELIKFAFWRTKVCKWLNSNAKRLSQELIKLE